MASAYFLRNSVFVGARSSARNERRKIQLLVAVVVAPFEKTSAGEQKRFGAHHDFPKRRVVTELKVFAVLD